MPARQRSDRTRPLTPAWAAPDIPRQSPFSKRELLLVAGVLLVGLVLRLAFTDRLGIEHFDEGVYASNLWFSAAESYRFPLRHLYAPPFLPWLIEWSLILSAQAQFAPFVPSLVSGCLLLPSIWWIGRRWFGPVAGIATVSLAAASDVQAIFTRMALTESVLVLALIWAVEAVARMVTDRRGRWPALALVAAGMAWWTKYNGWLPLAIASLAIPLYWLVQPAARRTWQLDALRWAIVVVGTALVWLPVWWDLQPFGGYAVVAANHARYVTGLSGWPSGAARQVANLRQLECTTLALAGPLLAVWSGAIVAMAGTTPAREQSGSSRGVRSWFSVLFGGGCWALASWLGGPAIASGAVAAVVIGRLAWQVVARRAPPSMEVCCLMVWWSGLFVATPLYTPYARLALPWLAASWLAAGWAVEQLLRRNALVAAPTDSPAEGSATWRCWGLLPVAGLLAALGLGWPTLRWQPESWQSHAGTRQAARAASSQIHAAAQGQLPVVLVYGEPAFFYELRVAGCEAVAPIGDFGIAGKIAAQATVPVWLAVGPHADHDAKVQQGLAALPPDTPRFQFPFRPSDATLLDRYPPEAIAQWVADHHEQFVLVRLK